MHSIPLVGSAFHAADRPRTGHRRVRALTEREWHQPIDVTLVLRERPGAPTVAQAVRWLSAQPGAALRDEQLHGNHDAAPQDRARVAAFAHANGLRVTGDEPATRRITLRAPAGRLGSAFGVQLERFAMDRAGGTVEYRGHLGPVRVPAALDGVLAGVFGLDDRPIARPHLAHPAADRASIVSYDPADVARIYAYPPLPDGGAGLHLVAGMIELGGVVHPADVAAAFARMSLPAPEIVSIGIDGAQPLPDPDGADVEIALDYQVIGAMVAAVAPNAKLTIVNYAAPNTERGFIDAVASAATDRVWRPAAVSISWGSAEDQWSLQGLRAMDGAFATGALRGVTYSAAAGDAGSANAVPDGHQHPEFPASSPHVWACGGTTLLALGGRIVSESVWNELDLGSGAAGSGVSGVFPVPEYQAQAGIHPHSPDRRLPGRGLPDGSGVADPVTGWNVLALGRLRVTGGTSAVAPMYTALWTLLAAARGARIGLPHPRLYGAGGRGFHDIVQGDTGGPYAAKRGWDAASGWGSPDGRVIARELSLPARRPALGPESLEVA